MNNLPKSIKLIFDSWFLNKFGRYPLEHNQKDMELREAFCLGLETVKELVVLE